MKYWPTVMSCQTAMWQTRNISLLHIRINKRPSIEIAPDFSGAILHVLFICRLVNANRATRRIVHFLERFIPLNRFSGRTSDGRTARHALSGARKREQFSKISRYRYASLRSACCTGSGSGQFPVVDQTPAALPLLQGVDPTVTDAIGELLFCRRPRLQADTLQNIHAGCVFPFCRYRTFYPVG